MAKPRSPILGYNHNVRYRGLVFHVQTEDSGVANPHVFTHLFHGGVILTTRKLVYDADAAEESVKALMQAQHKAVLRDLKKHSFDDKIDSYLGGTPGLLPREGTADDATPEPAASADTAPTPPPLAEPEPPPLELEPASAAPVALPDLPTMPVPGRATTAQLGTPPPTSVSIPRPGSRSGRMPAINSEEARAPTIEVEQMRASLEAEAPRPTTEVMIPEDPLAATRTRRDVSAAFDAIMVGEADAHGGGLVEVAQDDVGQVHSAAPASAPLPPGVPAVPPRATEYSQHRRRESGRIADTEPPPVATGPAVPPPLPPARHSQPRVATGPVIARPPTTPPAGRPSQPRVATPQSVPSPTPRATTQVYATPRTLTPTTPPIRPTAPRTRSPNNAGVVVTRPAVIIGAPSRTVSGTGPAPTLPATPPAAPPAPATGQHAAQKGRVRKAREDTDSGVFGQDLISEKSLDEVILAYLSEDGSDD